ncbi:hypothetical protein ACLOJK_000951 [Asimina triloba]
MEGSIVRIPKKMARAHRKVQVKNEVKVVGSKMTSVDSQTVEEKRSRACISKCKSFSRRSVGDPFLVCPALAFERIAQNPPNPAHPPHDGWLLSYVYYVTKVIRARINERQRRTHRSKYRNPSSPTRNLMVACDGVET